MTTTATRPGVTAYVGPYASTINRSARRNGLDPWLLAALLWVESKFNPHAVSATGDVGIAQINLASHPSVTPAEARNPQFAIPWAARYLAELKASTGSTTAALRAYNTGSGAASPRGDHYAARVLDARRKSLAASRQGSALNAGGYAGVDQGVDFSGRGAIPALAAGTVTDIGQVHIIEGGTVPYVVYRLDAGPHKGQHVYVMETFKPNVRVGQKLAAGQSIGYATGGGYGIEIGFNRTAKGMDPVAPLYPNPHGPKPAGESMLAYLQRRGLARGVRASGNPSAPLGPTGPTGSAHKGGSSLWDALWNYSPPGLAYNGVKGLYNGAKGAANSALSVGELAARVLTDPGYVFLWVGFAIVGLAFIFLGVERLMGRSASQDAGRAVTLVAAPEAAAVGGAA